MRKKFFIITTIPLSLNFFRGQLHLLNNTFKVMAISSDEKKLSEFADKEGIDWYRVNMKRSISLFRDICSMLSLIRLFLIEKPYIVHGNTPKASMLSMVAAWIARVPVRIYMCHGLRYQGGIGWMRKLLVQTEKITCLCATEVLCVSPGVKKTLIQDEVCNEAKLKVVLNGSANGIDTSYYNPENISDLSSLRIKLNINDTDFVYCFVGRIVEDKGINELINAFERLQLKLQERIHLIIVGPQESNLNPILKETTEKIERNIHIHMVGAQFDVRPFMAIANVFVLPSYREGFGMVLAEAGALGIPCITTDIIGCNEIIQDGINGKIIPPRDEKALYEMMKWFYEHRDGEVQDMARNSRPMIIERYEQHKVWDALLNEYCSL